MQHFQSILCVVRGTETDTETLKQALSLARNNGARLQVLVIAPALAPSFSEYRERFEAFLVEEIRTAIQAAKVALTIATDAVPVKVELECGDTPAIRIVRRVLREAYDLVVKQADGTKNVGFRAIDMQLLRECPCPVWLCRPIHRSRGEIRVAVAVDPQSGEPVARDLAVRLLGLARQVADSCSGELDIISCWDYELEQSLRHAPWWRVPEEEISREISSTERLHRMALDETIARSGIGGKLLVHHVRGHADRMIPAIVDSRQTDILIMGTVARTGIAGFVMGNTAENVLQSINCSVVAIKPNGFVSPVKAY